MSKPSKRNLGISYKEFKAFDLFLSIISIELGISCTDEIENRHVTGEKFLVHCVWFEVDFALPDKVQVNQFLVHC